jgi:hypothetical protein
VVAPQTGSVLAVDVVPAVAAAPALNPEHVPQEPRTLAGRFVISPTRPKARSGELLSFEARSRAGPLFAEWSTSDERVVAKLQENVFRAMERGEASVCATIANQRVCTRVGVTP